MPDPSPEFRTFVELARAVRRLQKEYFRSRTPELLRAARDAERRLDAAIEEFANPPRPTLFGDTQGENS